VAPINDFNKIFKIYQSNVPVKLEFWFNLPNGGWLS